MRSHHIEELARIGWAIFGFASSVMFVVCALAVGLGPESSQGVYAVATTGWLFCAWLSARGFKRQGL